MKTNVLKALSILMSAIMLFALCGCSESTPALGTFECIKAEYQDFSADPNLIYEGGAVLELNENGKGFLHLGNETGAISWKLDGEKLSLQFAKEVYEGTIEDDHISVVIQGLSLEFAKGVGNSAEADSVVQSMAYYGWWKISDGSGQWQDYSDMWFDAFAVVESDEAGNSRFVIWDEDSSYTSPIGGMSVSFEDAALKAGDGAFIDCKFSAGDWEFIADESFKDMLRAELPYCDDNGTFTAEICLRPWGIKWDDVEEDDPELLPYYYYDWYLPLVEAGSQMPGEFEIK